MQGEKRTGWRNAVVALLLLPVLIAFSGLLATDSRAEGLSGYLEFDYSRNDSDVMSASDPSIQTKSENFSQLYSLTLDKKIYPNLNFLASGFFRKRDDSFDVEGLENDTTTTTVQPYVNLNLRTPLYYAETSYSRNEEKLEPSGSSSVTTVRDQALATLYWRPDRFPDLKLQYSWDHVFDKDRQNVDTVTNLYQVTSNYEPVENLNLYYRGTFRDTDLQLTDTTTKEKVNNGRVNYFNHWWRRRITFGLDYNYTHQEIETNTSGVGEVGFPVFPFAGLSALSDIPENVVLAPNPALVDGNLAAGAGINLGLPPPGGDTSLRNLGLDFAVDTEVNTLYVWVDRDVAQVAGAFSWRIYTSDDNLNWVLRQTVSPAVYSPTFNRFEIRFTNVNARYVKAVTAPLSPTVPSASAYPVIFVTELQAEIRRPASDVDGTLTSTFQNGNLDFRAVLLKALALTYEFTYVFTKKDPGDLLYTASNGFSFFRQLNEVLSGRGRIAYETGDEQAGYRKALVYTASLTAVPYHTLYHSLVVSGKDETIAGENNTNLSILLYNIAKLYEGIDLNIGGGISFQEEETGRKNRNTLLNAGLTLVPNRKVNLTLLYNGTTTDSSGGNLQGDITEYTRAGEAALSITPVQTVYLYGSYRIESTTNGPSRNILNYTANWSPFPDGTLHLIFYYNETIRSDDQHDRSIIPSVRWYFTKRSYVNLSYENLKTETPALTTSSNIYNGTVRITF